MPKTYYNFCIHRSGKVQMTQVVSDSVSASMCVTVFLVKHVNSTTETCIIMHQLCMRLSGRLQRHVTGMTNHLGHLQFRAQLPINCALTVKMFQSSAIVNQSIG